MDSVCSCVCLFVLEEDISRTDQWIRMKLPGMFGLVTGANWLDSAADRAVRLIFLSCFLLNFWERLG